MKKLALNIENYFLSGYKHFPESIKEKSRYLLLTGIVACILLGISTTSYIIFSDRWNIIPSNLAACFFVLLSLVLLKKKKYHASSNLIFCAIFAALIFEMFGTGSITGMSSARVSELGDSLLHFTVGLIFIGFLSFKFYQPIVFTILGLITVPIHFYMVIDKHNLDFYSDTYIIRLIDAELFILFAGIGSYFCLRLSNALVAYLQKQSEKVKQVNKKLEGTVKLRTIELEVTNMELKEKTAELEKFNAELQLAKSNAEEASIAKEQFLSTMSHEIRTPLNAVIGMTHLLIEESPREDQQENLDVLQVSAKHLLGLINDILDFSKIESGKIDLEKIEFNTRELFSDLKKMFLYKAREKSLELELSIHDSVPEYLVGDTARLTQIISNLLSNAIKFTEVGKVEMIVSCEKYDSKTIQLIIDVKDTGIGIPQDKIDNIFDSFTQASSDTTRKYGGTGLGLAIIKRLVELQKGTIKLFSEQNVGSTFNVVIPYTKPTDTNEDKSNVVESDQTFEDTRILIVEDNYFNQEVVSKILDNQGIITETSDNGMTTLDLVQKNEYSVILMDINLPDMNGFEITEKIRKLEDPKKRKVPIIAQTADISTQSIAKAKEVGMDDVIAKPIIPSILFEKLKQVME